MCKFRFGYVTRSVPESAFTVQEWRFILYLNRERRDENRENKVEDVRTMISLATVMLNHIPRFLLVLPLLASNYQRPLVPYTVDTRSQTSIRR